MRYHPTGRSHAEDYERIRITSDFVFKSVFGSDTGGFIPTNIGFTEKHAASRQLAPTDFIDDGTGRTYTEINVHSGDRMISRFLAALSIVLFVLAIAAAPAQVFPKTEVLDIISLSDGSERTGVMVETVPDRYVVIELYGGSGCVQGRVFYDGVMIPWA